MPRDPACALAEHVADWLDLRAEDLARAWLEDLEARLAEPRMRVFPGTTLLDHIPNLLRWLAETLRNGTGLTPDAGRVMEELARLRRWQGYSREEVEGELELLGERVLTALEDAVASYPDPVAPAVAVKVGRRLHRALAELARIGAGAVEDESRRERRGHAEGLHLLARAITHELNNRLLAARFSLELADSRFAGGDPEGAAALGALGQTLEALEQVAGDVFAVALTQSRDAPVLGRWQPLRELVRDLIRDVRAYAGQRNVEVRCELDRVPEWHVDASRVQLVLVNLVVNAVKYSAPGEPRSWVELEVESEPGGWVIAVSDNGLGIPASARQRIFGPNYRVGQGDQSGEGIGLAVAREAATQLGGRLTVESAEGQGSIFRLRLPEPPTELPG